MLLEIKVFKTFVILCNPSLKGGKKILMSGRLPCVTIVILQQLFLIFIVQQTKAEVGSSYVSKTDNFISDVRGEGFYCKRLLIPFSDFVHKK